MAAEAKTTMMFQHIKTRNGHTEHIIHEIPHDEYYAKVLPLIKDGVNSVPLPTAEQRAQGICRGWLWNKAIDEVLAHYTPQFCFYVHWRPADKFKDLVFIRTSDKYADEYYDVIDNEDKEGWK